MATLQAQADALKLELQPLLLELGWLRAGEHSEKNEHNEQLQAGENVEQQNEQLQGGEILGEGTTAVVLSPPIPCTSLDDAPEGEVTKLYTNEVAYQEEQAKQPLFDALRALNARLVGTYGYEPFVIPSQFSTDDCQPLALDSLRRETRLDIQRALGDTEIETTAEVYFTRMPKVFPPENDPTEVKNELKTILDVLHANGIAHGDISPANYGFADQARTQVVLFDWGEAKLGASAADIEKDMRLYTKYFKIGEVRKRRLSTTKPMGASIAPIAFHFNLDDEATESVAKKAKIEPEARSEPGVRSEPAESESGAGSTGSFLHGNWRA